MVPAAEGLGTPPATPIVALPPIEQLHPGIPIDPNTGEPPHILTIGIAYALMLAAATAQAVGLGLAWWRAIHMETFSTSVRLIAWWQPTPGSAASIFLAILMMLIGVTLVAAPALTGYLGWVGRPAAAKWALGALAVTVLTALVTPPNWDIIWGNIGWCAVPLTLIGALYLWTPGSHAAMQAWQAFRHPAPPVDTSPTGPIAYGRLEQFR